MIAIPLILNKTKNWTFLQLVLDGMRHQMATHQQINEPHQAPYVWSLPHNFQFCWDPPIWVLLFCYQCVLPQCIGILFSFFLYIHSRQLPVMNGCTQGSAQWCISDGQGSLEMLQQCSSQMMCMQWVCCLAFHAFTHPTLCRPVSDIVLW